MPVSLAGPAPEFDISTSYGIPVSEGFSQRAPDGVTAYGQNGVLYEAELFFNGVQGRYKVRKTSGHTNEDFETWWLQGPAQGRRMLMWRDRDNATGSNAPSEGSASPYNYIEYAPQESLRKKMPVLVSGGSRNLYYHDVKLDLWVTENGETPLTD
jgi:hypothetical protein